MKKIALVILLALFMACSDDNDPGTDQGCLTGIPIGQTERILIRCSTEQQFLAGSNTSKGGTASWDLYTSHKWAKCDDCQ